MKRHVLLTITLSLTPAIAHSDGKSNCAEDLLGDVVCAPPGGIAVSTLQEGVLCAPGECVVNNLGYWECSISPGGGATTDNLGRAVCNGGCVAPNKEFCEEIPVKREERNEEN